MREIALQSLTLGGVVFELAAVSLVLFLLPWAAIFGGAGALLAWLRDGSVPLGFAWGLLGPPGCLVVWLRTRQSPVAAVEELELADDGWSTL